MTGRRYFWVCACLLLLILPVMAFGESSYGPGHESHQYASWDNGDGTHTVACDCGVEKRVEEHVDADADGVCDGCGLELNEGEEGVLPDGWVFIGYEPGGVAYAVPEDMVMWELADEQLRTGIVAIGSNADITVQLRGYEPWTMTYDEFVGVLKSDTMAVYEMIDVDGTEAVYYRNPDPGKQSELGGVVLTGLDGRMYKISVFSGDNGNIGSDAMVWEYMDIIASTVHTSDMNVGQ